MMTLQNSRHTKLNKTDIVPTLTTYQLIKYWLCDYGVLILMYLPLILKILFAFFRLFSLACYFKT